MTVLWIAVGLIVLGIVGEFLQRRRAGIPFVSKSPYYGWADDEADRLDEQRAAQERAARECTRPVGSLDNVTPLYPRRSHDDGGRAA